ncbi:LysR family transcriptional regulator [Stappia indica]|uniref:LysR family transcriptional regulator n=1 Tax=Stappia indica TaxID=538381 RepID=UPI00082D10B9|nr:LysR substrate-binding domain-containing protein [Stappia indica]
MNLRSVDLNLLVILDALLDEAHVSRAAERLGLTQPAVSAALQRCRGLFGDELLERGRGTMRRTERAEALRAPLKTLLAGVVEMVDPTPTPLAKIKQTLKISMADYPAVLVMQPLMAHLGRTAPGIDLVLQPWQGADAARAGLVAGSSDLALSVFPPSEDDLVRTELVGEHYVVAMRADHPAAREFDLAAWLAHPHVLVSGRGDTRGPLDTALAAKGLCRRVGVVVPTFQMVPGLLAGSDLIAMLPSRCVPPASGLATFAPPVPVPGFVLHLAWHTRRNGDTALRYVAQVLAEIMLSDVR